MNDPMTDQPEYENKPQRSGATPNWVIGGILILIGVVLLFQNLLGFHLVNWWALFILIPAYDSFNRAYQMYQGEGRFSRAVRGKLTNGAILALVAAAFLFNVSFNLIWPLFLIGGGVMILVNALLPE